MKNIGTGIFRAFPFYSLSSLSGQAAFVLSFSPFYFSCLFKPNNKWPILTLGPNTKQPSLVSKSFCFTFFTFYPSTSVVWTETHGWQARSSYNWKKVSLVARKLPWRRSSKVNTCEFWSGCFRVDVSDFAQSWWPEQWSGVVQFQVTISRSEAERKVASRWRPGQTWKKGVACCRVGSLDFLRAHDNRVVCRG